MNRRSMTDGKKARPAFLPLRFILKRYAVYALGAPAVVLAAAEMPAWVGTAWSYLLLVLGFSLVIFVHELGHFAAAKWAGVRVERFAIGFGKEIFGFAIGETRYSFNVLPLGGYVKMLGQEDFVVDKSGELKVKGDPRSFTNKSIGQRMVIISAGVIMNLLFAALAFMIIVMVGRLLPPSVVGQVMETSPAARAGLQTGDRILAVNDRPIESFGDLSAAVTLSDPDETLVLDVMRDGQPVEPKPRILPEYKENAKVRQIGVGPGMNLRAMFPSLTGVENPAPNELHENDLLHRMVIDGEMVAPTDLAPFRRAIVEARGRPVDFWVRRPTDPESIDRAEFFRGDAQVPSEDVRVSVRALWTPIPYEISESATGSLLGLVPRLTLLFADEGRSFDDAGAQGGDIIFRIGSNAYPSYPVLQRTIEENDGKEITLEVSRPRAANGPLSAAAVAFCVAHREALIASAVKDPTGIVAAVSSAAAKDGLHPSDLTQIADALATRATSSDIRRWFERVDVHVLAGFVPDAPFSLFGSPLPKVDGQLRCVNEPGVIVADVVVNLGDRPSPAKAAGIPVGAVIYACDDRQIADWTELSEALRAAAGRAVKLSYRVADDFATATFPVPPCITAALDLPYGARITSIDGRDTFTVTFPTGGDGESRSAEIALPDWRAVEAGLKASVGRTVSIHWVTYEGQKREDSYAVTVDNVDPWLHRVFYAEPFFCYPLLERRRVSNPILAVGVGFREAYEKTMQTVQSIRHMLITHQVGVGKVSGPVGIVRIGSKFAESGPMDLLWFLAVISANLAVLNFLPLPIVDGGLFLFLVLEKIRGEPVSIKTQVATQLVGIALIASLFLLVTYKDIKDWITGA